MFINLLRWSNRGFSFALLIFASAGYLLSYFFQTTIITWDLILLISFPIAFLFIYFLEKTSLYNSDARYSKSSLFLALLPFLIFCPLFWNLLSSTELQISYHGELHGSYVQQILHGIGQPQNPYVFDSNPNYPWLYHALIATISHISQLPHPYARSILNIILFLSTFGWIYEVLIIIFPQKLSPLMLTLLAIFALCGLNLFGFLHSMVDLWNDFSIWKVFHLISPEPFIESVRLRATVDKYITYTSSSIGYLYAWISIYAVIRFIKRKDTIQSFFWFFVGIAGGLAFLLAGGLFIPIVLVTTWVVILVIYLVVDPKLAKSQLIPAVSLGDLPYVFVSLLIILPLIHYFFLAKNGIAGATTFSLINFTNLTMIFSSFYPILPLLAIAIFIAWVEKEPLTSFLVISCLISLSVAAFVKIITEPDGGNEYKFTLFSTFLITLTSIVAIKRLQFQIHNKVGQVQFIHLEKPIICLIFLCIAINTLGIAAQNEELQEKWEDSRAYFYDGNSIVSQLNPYQEIFSWLRTQTSPETILLIPLEESFDATLLSERSLYVSQSNYGLGESSLNYEGAIQVVNSLYNLEPSDQVWQESLGVILHDIGANPLAFVVPNGSQLNETDLEQFDLNLVYATNVASIYLHQP